MSRLTARAQNGLAYLVGVRQDEQEVNSPYKNTLQCILDCFQHLAAIEDVLYAKDGTELITLDRLREICAAEREQKCLILNEQTALAMCAGARAIEKYNRTTYVYDVFGKCKEIPYLVAAKLLREAAEAALKGASNEA